MSRRIVSIDMDGCLCRVNSFRLWLAYSPFVLLITLRWVRLFLVLYAVAHRVSGLSDRVEMKRRILLLTEDLHDRWLAYFCRFLGLYTNREVLDLARKYQLQELGVVLNTAAPCFYAQPYAESLGFRNVLCTGTAREEDWKENIREQKVAALERGFGPNYTIECAISDHHDDLPVMLVANEVILVNPSKVTLDAVAGRVKFHLL